MSNDRDRTVRPFRVRRNCACRHDGDCGDDDANPLTQSLHHEVVSPLHFFACPFFLFIREHAQRSISASVEQANAQAASSAWRTACNADFKLSLFALRTLRMDVLRDAAHASRDDHQPRKRGVTASRAAHPFHRLPSKLHART
jgi:hypothetical protein